MPQIVVKTRPSNTGSSDRRWRDEFHESHFKLVRWDGERLNNEMGLAEFVPPTHVAAWCSNGTFTSIRVPWPGEEVN